MRVSLQQAAWYLDATMRQRQVLRSLSSKALKRQAPDLSVYSGLIRAFAKRSQMREVPETCVE